MVAEFIAVHLARAVISQVVQKLGDLLANEAKSLSSVRDDVEYLKRELKFINGFLEDADRRQKQEGLVRDWIAEVRDVACEIEDAIEIYVSNVDSAFIRVLRRRKLRSRIKSIKNNLQSLRERSLTYQIQLNNVEEGTSSLRNLRKSYPEEEEDVVSMKDVAMNLKARLLKEEDELRIVSIVGMGGLGKTTLAKKVYNDVGVKRHFDMSAWVCISQQYVVKEVLIEILLQVGFERKNLGGGKSKEEFLTEKTKKRELLKSFEEQDLIDLIQDELKEKKYLLVLDDIWSIEAWHSIKKAFPKGRGGSKVLFTTRITELATSVDPFSTSIEPPLLTEEEGWELLQRKAFSGQVFGNNNGSRSEFEKLGKEMVRKCAGLPLAVVVLGGLLSTKTALGEWKKVHKDVSFQLNKLKSPQQYAVEEILDLSYQELPFFLKPCFLYLSCFPEDSEISKKRLIRLWIAEGFVPRLTRGEIEETLMEEVAEHYLGELINRSMVQVERRDHTGGAVKTCRLHDLMRDFCISKSRNENFFEIMAPHKTSIVAAGSSSVQYSSTTHSRRIAFHFDDGLGNHAPWMEKVNTNLRSLICFGINIFPNLSLKNGNLKLLRVLELVFVPFPRVRVPKEIGNLIHLRYLKFRGADISKLPNSVGNLRYLHTLDLRHGYKYIRVSGNAISKLVHLRHLLLPDMSNVRGPLRIENLSNLETLKTVNGEKLIRNDAVVNLPNLRDLGVRFKSAEEARLILQSLGSKLARLRSLRLFIPDEEFPSSDILFESATLYKLYVEGRLSQQHYSFLPKSLVKLELQCSQLNQDIVIVLEKMENLRILQYACDGYDYHSWRWISRGAIMSKMVFSAHGFPKLEILRLDDLDLEEWEVGEDAMANLKRLDISWIPKLKMIPDGLKYVTTLQELNISYMSRKFEGRLRVIDGVEGEDFHKVQHVPSISFSYTQEHMNSFT
ncbi:hypothetical protein UlMin_026015 [Ulmus minor]